MGARKSAHLALDYANATTRFICPARTLSMSDYRLHRPDRRSIRQRERQSRAWAKILQRPECTIDLQRLLRHHQPPPACASSDSDLVQPE
jgi:hypothetical protein